MKCNYWWVWPHHLFTFFKLHSTLGIKFSKTGFLQLVDCGSQPLTYETGPIADPWTILAVIDSSDISAIPGTVRVIMVDASTYFFTLERKTEYMYINTRQNMKGGTLSIDTKLQQFRQQNEVWLSWQMRWARTRPWIGQCSLWYCSKRSAPLVWSILRQDRTDGRQS